MLPPLPRSIIPDRRRHVPRRRGGWWLRLVPLRLAQLPRAAEADEPALAQTTSRAPSAAARTPPPPCRGRRRRRPGPDAAAAGLATARAVPRGRPRGQRVRGRCPIGRRVAGDDVGAARASASAWARPAAAAPSPGHGAGASAPSPSRGRCVVRTGGASRPLARRHEGKQLRQAADRRVGLDGAVGTKSLGSRTVRMPRARRPRCRRTAVADHDRLRRLDAEGAEHRAERLGGGLGVGQLAGVDADVDQVEDASRARMRSCTGGPVGVGEQPCADAALAQRPQERRGLGSVSVCGFTPQVGLRAPRGGVLDGVSRGSAASSSRSWRVPAGMPPMRWTRSQDSRSASRRAAVRWLLDGGEDARRDRPQVGRSMGGTASACRPVEDEPPGAPAASALTSVRLHRAEGRGTRRRPPVH